jgi:tRNA (cytidine/uridine-2'-O-)-methyltransferase
MRLALYQPDIAPNAATLMRLCACLGIPMDLIEPAGFIVSDSKFRRAGMDYLDRLDLVRHASWERFQARRHGRLVLATTKATLAHYDARFQPTDIVLVGRETSGVPDEVHAAADLRVTVPMCPDMRSLNVAVAAAMVLGEALRQTGLYPERAA